MSLSSYTSTTVQPSDATRRRQPCSWRFTPSPAPSRSSEIRMYRPAVRALAEVFMASKLGE